MLLRQRWNPPLQEAPFHSPVLCLPPLHLLSPCLLPRSTQDTKPHRQPEPLSPCVVGLPAALPTVSSTHNALCFCQCYCGSPPGYLFHENVCCIHSRWGGSLSVKACTEDSASRGVKLDFYVSALRTKHRTASLQPEGDLCFSAKAEWEAFWRSRGIKGTQLNPTTHLAIWPDGQLLTTSSLSWVEKTRQRNFNIVDGSNAGSTFAFDVNVKYVKVRLFYQELSDLGGLHPDSSYMSINVRSRSSSKKFHFKEKKNELTLKP